MVAGCVGLGSPTRCYGLDSEACAQAIVNCMRPWELEGLRFNKEDRRRHDAGAAPMLFWSQQGMVSSRHLWRRRCEPPLPQLQLSPLPSVCGAQTLTSLLVCLLCSFSVPGGAGLCFLMMPPFLSLDLTVVLGVKARAKPSTLYLNASDVIKVKFCEDAASGIHSLVCIHLMFCFFNISASKYKHVLTFKYRNLSLLENKIHG